MSVPGVSVITAKTFTPATGAIRRFRSPGKLVGYLGLDPKVRQSGAEPTRHGRISKAGPGAVRHTLTRPRSSRSVRQDRCAPSMNASVRAVAIRSRPRSRPQARRPVLAPPHQRRGLRIRKPDPDPEEAAPDGAHRRRPVTQRPPQPQPGPAQASPNGASTNDWSATTPNSLPAARHRLATNGSPNQRSRHLTFIRQGAPTEERRRPPARPA